MKMDRNDKCWCKSGIKYKFCHLKFDERLDSLQKKGYLIPPHNLIKSESQIEGIKEAAKINNAMLDYIEDNIKEGISTLEIDNWCVDFLKKHHAHSADYNYEGYPKSICTSVNDVVCHGIPNEKTILKNGDIINVDATTEYNGFYADASRMFMIGNVSEEAKRLVYETKECLNVGIKSIVPWKSKIGDIGKAIEEYAHSKGYSVVEEYCGHGVGLSMHEEPYVYHFNPNIDTYVIVPGMVITIEPMINEGKKGIRFKEDDSWSSYTIDGKLSAQWENTLLVTEDGVEIISF